MGADAYDTRSLWMATGPTTDFLPLQGSASADVAIIGAGISGLSAARLLVAEGLDVAVVDAGRVGQGVTARTTAKLSSLHQLVYADLESSFGAEGARAHGEANEFGIRHVEETARELGIDCDFRRRPNYTFAESPQELDQIEDEVNAAKRAGLPASYVSQVPLPFEVAGAVRFDDQAEFHPLKYLVGLARHLAERGCRIYERTLATKVRDGRPAVVETEGGMLSAQHVIVASHFPFLDRGLFFARMHPERSYAVAGPLPGDAPEGMFINVGQPTRSIRFAPAEGGGELVLVGGEGHKVGQGGATGPRYGALEDYARGHFGVASIDYRWSTQDNMPVDGLPYIGRLTPRSQRTYTVTGFRKWGLAQSAAAAMILRDLILERDNAWAEVYDSNRFKPLAAAKDLVKENLNVGFHFFADRLTRRALGSPAAVRPGEGRVFSRRERQVAVSRELDGTLLEVSARCTHMGCIVNWNDAERSWDCPCHGSRFAPDGTVLQGPAIAPLERE